MGTHFRRTLIHTCTIERPTLTASTSGEPIPAWDEVATGVRCRRVQKRERIAAEGISLQMATQDLLLFESDVDVCEEDRVVDIARYRDGTLLDAGPFTVEAVLERNAAGLHHLSVEIERIE